MGETWVTDKLAPYLAARDADRTRHAEQLLAAMTKRERSLVREVAIHAYVQGLIAGKSGEQQPPPDSAVLYSTLLGCLSMPDINPTMDRIDTLAARLAARRARALTHPDTTEQP